MLVVGIEPTRAFAQSLVRAQRLPVSPHQHHMAANPGNPEGQDAETAQALPLAWELFPSIVERENQIIAERIVFRRLKPRLGHSLSRRRPHRVTVDLHGIL